MTGEFPFSSLKRVAQRHVPQDHWHCMSWCRARFGMARACASYFELRRHPGVYIVDRKAANVRCDIELRPGTMDQEVFNEVFVARQYDLEGIEDPKVIVDAGAHIGLASVMFASRYPQARVFALEPEASNFALLARNTRGYSNIRPVLVGLWERPTRLRIANPDAATWAFQVVEDARHGDVRALSIPELMKQARVPRIDVLKIDIEGSEIEVLRGAASWIEHVGVLLIELHDRLRPGCTQALDGALAGYRCERTSRGVNTVVRAIQRSAAIEGPAKVH